MQIIAKCPKCSANWVLSEGSADKRIRCRRCGRLFKVPRLNELPQATSLINQAKGTIYVDETGKTFG